MTSIFGGSRSLFIGFGMLLAAPFATTDAMGQTTMVGTVPEVLIQAVDQAAASGNPAAMDAAVTAILSDSSENEATYDVAVTAAIKGCNPAKISEMVYSFVIHHEIYAAGVARAAASAVPDKAVEIAEAAAKAAGAYSAAPIVIGTIQGLPKDKQTADMVNAIAARVKKTVPAASDFIDAYINLLPIAGLNATPATQPAPARATVKK